MKKTNDVDKSVTYRIDPIEIIRGRLQHLFSRYFRMFERVLEYLHPRVLILGFFI